MIPSSCSLAFAGLDDVPVSLVTVPNLSCVGWLRSEISGLALLSLKMIQAWGSVFLKIILKCMLHIYAVQRIWIFSKLPVCSGLKYNPFALAAFGKA